MHAPSLVVALLGIAGSASAQQSPPSGSSGTTLPARIAPAALVTGPAYGVGNLVTNGDFEVHSGPACNSNIVNTSLGSFVTGATGFGAANEIDVYANPPCYGLTAHSGSTKIALHAQEGGAVNDAFSLVLARPVVAGETCVLSFWTHVVTDFDPNLGTIEVGLSSAANSFGTLVASGTSTTTFTWEHFTATFTAPVTGDFITLGIVGDDSWIHLDEVTLIATSATTLCHGDGTGTPCPCGNDAPPGSWGCLNSLGVPGTLGSAGLASVSADSLVLNGSAMPNSSALYFQGTQVLNGGAGVVFGDGLRCAAGTIVRLGTKTNSAGASAYPGPGDPAIHVRGACLPGDLRRYQVWYRNAAAFCTLATYNLTNGLEVTWSI
jgi:hypothetical protein